MPKITPPEGMTFRPDKTGMPSYQIMVWGDSIGDVLTVIGVGDIVAVRKELPEVAARYPGRRLTVSKVKRVGWLDPAKD